MYKYTKTEMIFHFKILYFEYLSREFFICNIINITWENGNNSQETITYQQVLYNSNNQDFWAEMVIVTQKLQKQQTTPFDFTAPIILQCKKTPHKFQ